MGDFLTTYLVVANNGFQISLVQVVHKKLPVKKQFMTGGTVISNWITSTPKRYCSPCRSVQVEMLPCLFSLNQFQDNKYTIVERTPEEGHLKTKLIINSFLYK